MPPKIGVRLSLPHLQGAYLALNAIPDAYFLGDGPSCIFSKAEQIHGRHDLFSTLLSCDGEHRVQHTGVNVFNIAGNLEPIIVGALRRMASWPDCGALFLGSMPMCTIAGTDYERVLREALPERSKPAFLIPRRSAVAGDWLDGYAAVLEALAAGMDLAGAKPEANAVGVVGYLMDRNEGEHEGNLRELEAMLGGLGLKPAAIWLSGTPYESLRGIRRAGTIVSLPHARKAGRILSRRLGVKLVEAELPFGLAASTRFVERLGREFGCEERARSFVRERLDAIAPRLEWSVPHAFLRRRFVFIGDPHYAAGFAELVEELGGELKAALVMGGAHHLQKEDAERLKSRTAVVFEPLTHEAAELWDRLEKSGVDLVVGNGNAFAQLRPKAPWMEFGFPSEFTHFLKEEPFLGFTGALAFLSRTANEVTRGLCLDGGHGN